MVEVGGAYNCHFLKLNPRLRFHKKDALNEKIITVVEQGEGEGENGREEEAEREKIGLWKKFICKYMMKRERKEDAHYVFEIMRSWKLQNFTETDHTRQ